MKKIFYFITIITLVIFIFNGCKKSDEAPTPNPPPVTAVNDTNKTINGSAQKGPFLIGSSISVYELFHNYTQTGRSFTTQITDNSGSFQLTNVPLITNYVQIRADGFYFNEVCGSNSISQLTLNCIANTGNTGSLNINLLTHLEKPRVEYLLSTGMPFDSAKNEAQREVLNIFNITSNGIQLSEHLDISQAGEGNAVLLAISTILQGFRTESELSTLLAVISNDIRVDGILNDANAQSSIIDHALLLDTVSIRNNVSNFYLSLGISASIPYFEKYIQQFISNSTFALTNSVITYPAMGLSGNNLLLKTQLIYNGAYFSMAGQIKKCSFLTIRLHALSGDLWYIYSGTGGCNLNPSSYNFANREQFFTVIDPDFPFDLHFENFTAGTYLVEYFEINPSTPSFTKTITVN